MSLLSSPVTLRLEARQIAFGWIAEAINPKTKQVVLSAKGATKAVAFANLRNKILNKEEP